MRVAVIFPTYNRRELAQRLIDSINKQKTMHDVSVHAFIDGSEYLLNDCYNYTLSHHGKELYWNLYNKIVDVMMGKYDYYIYMADDLVINDKFIDKAVEMYDKGNCIALSLNSDEKVGKFNWTNFKCVNEKEYIITQWVDMCMIFKGNFFNVVGSIPCINSNRWKKNKLKSSGVGEYISKTLHKRGFVMKHLKSPLCDNGSIKSVMNEKARKINNLTKYPLIGGMATFKGRERCIIDAVNSIINQLDELHIYANDDIDLSSFDNNSKIIIHRHPLGDLGDAGKFYLPLKNAYFFTLDDDLIYPSNYVENMIYGIKKYNCVVTHHGRNLINNAVSYYKGAREKYRCLDNVIKDVIVDFPGTGVMAWCSDYILFDVKDFPSKNMADVHAACKIKSENKKAMCLSHVKGWIKHSNKLNMNTTIGCSKGKEKDQMTYINKYFL